MGFPVYLFSVLSLSCFLAFSLLLTFSVSTLGFLWGRLSPEAHRTDGELWQSSCLWKRKTTLSHFLLFCLKLATGVAYLSRTEILEVARQGVSAITSSPIISFRLINVKSYHNSSIIVSCSAFTTRHSLALANIFVPVKNDKYFSLNFLSYTTDIEGARTFLELWWALNRNPWLELMVEIL